MGWRNVGELLMEVVATSSVSGINNRGSLPWLPFPPMQGHHVFPSYREAVAPKPTGRSGITFSLVLEQFCEDDGRRVSGLHLETLMHAFVEMETQVGTLQTNIGFIKRCVKEGMQRDFGDGLGLKGKQVVSSGPHTQAGQVAQRSCTQVQPAQQGQGLKIKNGASVGPHPLPVQVAQRPDTQAQPVLPLWRGGMQTVTSQCCCRVGLNPHRWRWVRDQRR